MADFRKWFLAFAVVFAFVLAMPASAQIFGGTITDSPQHGFVAGAGVGPTTKDFSVIAGYADRIGGTAGTYSYSGVSVVPAFVTQASGARSLSVTTVAHTGIKQVLYQQNRFTLAVDGGAGASLPSSTSSGFNFSAVAGVDFVWRLNSALNSTPGGTNNYIAFEPQFTQLTGTPGGTVISVGVAWVHGVNGTAASTAALKRRQQHQ